MEISKYQRAQKDKQLQIQIGTELKTISSWAARRAAVGDVESLNLLREYWEIIWSGVSGEESGLCG